MTHHSAKHRFTIGAGLALSMAALAAGCSNDFDSGSDAKSDEGLTVMIGSSGPAETTTTQKIAEAFTQETGVKVNVIPAQDLTQQLGQAFAGGNPPDLFYVGPSQVGQYANAGNLYAYGDKTDLSEYDPTILESYTVDGVVQCVPKDSGGVLALNINTDMWAAAGLTEADYPTTWEELHTVAQKLTTPDHVGLSFPADRDRVGALMVGAGGWYLNDDNTKVTADSPENLEALTYLQSMLKDGSFAWSADVGAGWGGEAFGMQKTAMTVEGGWLPSVMESDYPDVKYTAIQMPAGAAGPGTLNFTNCWGVAADSDDHANAVKLVEFFNSDEQAKVAAEGYGLTPARTSLNEWTYQNFPEQVIYLTGLEYSKGQVSVPGFDSVLADFNSQLEGLKDGDPKAILQSLNDNATAALEAASK